MISRPWSSSRPVCAELRFPGQGFEGRAKKNAKRVSDNAKVRRRSGKVAAVEVCPPLGRSTQIDEEALRHKRRMFQGDIGRSTFERGVDGQRQCLPFERKARAEDEQIVEILHFAA